MSLVSEANIAEAVLCNSRPVLQRPYGWPFAIPYATFLYYYVNHYETHIGGGEWTYVYLGAIVSLQLLMILIPFWNINLKQKFETVSASDVETAEMIKVVPDASAGVPAICPILTDDEGTKSFYFHKRHFTYNTTTKQFSPPVFAIDQKDVTVSAFQKATGLNSATVTELHRIYGDNKFDIPIPTFLELWKEHAVAPLFIFQLFCIALWVLDDKWYFSLFNLFMLFGFESTVVWQRQRTLTEFRGMGVQPYTIYVFRDNKWIEILSDKLLPGDVVSVNRSSEDSGLPCDLLLLSGTAIVNEAMLSGESTPLLKESLYNRPATAPIDVDGIDKNSVLYGGTKVLQTSFNKDESPVPASPDGGAVAVVVRSGFETSQGSLVRVMIFSTERVGAGNKEAYFFILFLLMFAIVSAWYVWTEGVKMDRKRSKLLLDCILIITSVVPPELPMELTLAVNASLAALGKYYIYCTEPFRIPLAGRIDVCCFDKTGTLTAENLTVEGVAGYKPNLALSTLEEVPRESIVTMAAAHALVQLDDGEVVGDPMEKVTLKSLKWTVQANDVVQSSADSKDHIKILKRFQFSSALKRSSSVAKLADGSYIVAAKGAPETIQKMLVEVPEDYEELYQHYTREGSRVLALASKNVPKLKKDSDVVKYSRESAETELSFAGFLVFHSPLKSDAIDAIKMLNNSSHRVVIITGDNPLTAVKVAEQTNVTEREVLICDCPENSTHELVWHTVDGKTQIPVDPEAPLDLSVFEEYDLCVSGYALNRLLEHPDLDDLICHTWIWARVSPAHKEFILLRLKDCGYMTLMCGDGTNDVGALKQSHIGIALLNGTEEGMKAMMEKTRTENALKMYEKQCQLMRKWGQPEPPVPLIIAHLFQPGPKNPHYLKAVEKRGGPADEATKARVAQLLADQAAAARNPQNAPNAAAGLADKLTEMMGDVDDGEAPSLKLGDASVAAPLTSKLANVNAVVNIIRQGRSTLVATIQMYKILALNCLISAYSLSVLYLAGIKFGDAQVTISGLLLSVCFMSISRAKATDTLSKERPQPGIFNTYIMGSILLQFAVHIVTLIFIVTEVHKIEPKIEKVDLDSKFTPSLLNTAVYLLQLIQQISTFAVNYQGRPFREALTENKGMFYGILGVAGLAFSGATEFMPEMNESLSLVKMSAHFKTLLTTTMILDFGLCYVIEVTLKHFFSDYRPSDIALRLSERPKLLQRRKKL